MTEQISLFDTSFAYGWKHAKRSVKSRIAILLTCLGLYIIMWLLQWTTDGPLEQIENQANQMAQTAMQDVERLQVEWKTEQDIEAFLLEQNYQWQTINLVKENLGWIASSLGLNALISILFGIAITVWLLSISLRYVKEESFEYKTFWSEVGKKKYWKIIRWSILYSLAMLLGFLLFIIPGIMISIRCKMFDFILLEEDISAFAALKKSWKITKGHFWRLFGLQIVMGLITLLGALCLLIGLFWAIPAVTLMWAKMYKLLSSWEEVSA